MAAHAGTVAGLGAEVGLGEAAGDGVGDGVGVGVGLAMGDRDGLGRAAEVTGPQPASVSSAARANTPSLTGS
jgi:hypothetical protein